MVLLRFACVCVCGDRAREGVTDENFPNPGQVGC